MTTGDMIQELRRALGNRNDIDDQRYTLWLNWAQYDVTGFHGRRGRFSVRFSELESFKFLDVEPENVTIVGSAARSVTLASEPSLSIVEGQNIEIEGNNYNLIINHTGTLLSLAKSIEDIEDIGEGRILPRILSLDGVVNRHWLLEEVSLVNTGEHLTPRDWRTYPFSEEITEPGFPSQFYRHANFIYLDRPINARTIFKLYVYRTPRDLNNLQPNESSELPTRVHELIVLGAVWRGHERLMEPDRAEMAKQKYTQEMATRLDNFAMQDSHTQRSVRVRRS